MLFTYPLTLEIQLNRTKLGYVDWQTFRLHLTNRLTLWRLSMKYISILRGYISGTHNGQTNIFYAGVYRHKYLVLGRDKSLKCRKQSLIPAESSQKLKSSKCLCLIDSIFVVNFWQWLFPPFVIWHLHHTLLSVDLRIGNYSSRHFFVLSFRLNVVFFILYSDTTLCRYPTAPTYCCRNIPMCRHTNAPTLHCFNKIYVKW